MTTDFIKILGALIGFASILFLAYVTTKFIAGQSGKAMKGKYIQIVDAVSIGIDKRLYLLKVGAKYVLIATSGKTVEFLTNIDNHDIEEEGLAGEDQQPVFNFKSLFDKYLQGYKDKGVKKEEMAFNFKAVYQNEDSSFKRNLGKLKGLNEKMNGQGSKSEDDTTNEEKA